MNEYEKYIRRLQEEQVARQMQMYNPPQVWGQAGLAVGALGAPMTFAGQTAPQEPEFNLVLLTGDDDEA